MADYLSSSYSIKFNYFEDLQTISAYNLKYNIFKPIDKYVMYQDNLNLYFLSAGVLYPSISTVIYYNSDFSVDTCVSAFSWSENIKNKYILSNNENLNKIKPNLAASNILPLTAYENLNKNTYILSAYCNNINKDYNLEKTINCYVSTVIPELTEFKKMYIPVKHTTYFLNPFIAFPTEKFGNYIANTNVQAINPLFSSDICFESIWFQGSNNNNSKISTVPDYKYTSSYLSGDTYNYTDNDFKDLHFTYNLEYTINTFNNDPYRAFLYTIYPVATNLLAKCYLVEDNSYDVYTNLILSNLKCANCTINDLTFKNLNNAIAYINKKTKSVYDINETTISYTSANYYRIHFDVMTDNNFFDETININQLESHILHCIYLHPYQFRGEVTSNNLNNYYQFNLPNLSKFDNIYTINLEKELMADYGLNDLFNFNFTPDRNIIFTSNDLSTTFISTLVLDINTDIINPLYESQHLSKVTSANYHIVQDIYDCWPISSTIGRYNYYDYNIVNFTNDNPVSSILDITCCSTYISATFNNKTYINTMSATYLLSSIKDTFAYKPLFSNLYTDISTNFDKLQDYTFTYLYAGKFFNRTNEDQIYIYLNDKDTLNNYYLTSGMLEQHIPEASSLIFDTYQFCFGLNKKVEITSAIYARISGLFASAYFTFDQTSEKIYFDSYNYDLLNTYLTVDATYKTYNYILNDVYVKIPQYFIGSENTDYYIDNLSGVKINQDKKLEFEPINIKDEHHLLQITDTISTTYMNLSSVYFNPNQYLLLENTIDNQNTFILTSEITGQAPLTGKVIDISNCIYNNYNIITNDFIYDSTNTTLTGCVTDFLSGGTNCGIGYIYNPSNIIKIKVDDIEKGEKVYLLPETKYILKDISALVDISLSHSTSAFISDVSACCTSGNYLISYLSGRIIQLSGYVSFEDDLSTYVPIADQEEYIVESLPPSGSYYLSGTGITTLQNVMGIINNNANIVCDHYLLSTILPYTSAYQTLKYENTYNNFTYLPDNYSLENLYVAYVPNTNYIPDSAFLSADYFTNFTILSGDYFKLDRVYIDNFLSKYSYYYNFDKLFTYPVTSMYASLDDLSNDIKSSHIYNDVYNIKFGNKNSKILKIEIDPDGKSRDDITLYFKLSGTTNNFGVFKLEIRTK